MSLELVQPFLELANDCLEFGHFVFGSGCRGGRRLGFRFRLSGRLLAKRRPSEAKAYQCAEKAPAHMRFPKWRQGSIRQHIAKNPCLNNTKPMLNFCSLIRFTEFDSFLIAFYR